MTMGLSNAANLPDIIIISAYQSTKDEESNKAAHQQLGEDLTMKGYKYDEAQGVWQGQMELSYIVPINQSSDLEWFDFMCRIYNQECSLLAKQYKHGLRKSFFNYPDGTSVFQGYLKEVTKEQALECGAYTYVPSLKRYWAIVDTDNTQPHIS